MKQIYLGILALTSMTIEASQFYRPENLAFAIYHELGALNMTLEDEGRELLLNDTREQFRTLSFSLQTNKSDAMNHAFSAIALLETLVVLLGQDGLPQERIDKLDGYKRSLLTMLTLIQD